MRDPMSEASTTVVPEPFRRTYEYDARDRLVAVRADDGSAIAYVYDESGNRVRERRLRGSGSHRSAPETSPPTP